ncbi:hypothetical protein D3C71_876050 [compost metagenome]
MRSVLPLTALLVKVFQDPDAFALMLLDLAKLHLGRILRGVEDCNVFLDLDAHGEVVFTAKEFGDGQCSPPLLKGES